MIYLVHYNYDYDESMCSSRDLRAILENIRDAFGVEAEITHPDFASEVDESYEGGNWKGFTFHALDPETAAHLAIDLSKASKAVVSNHTMVEFQGKLEASFEKVRRQRAAKAA